MPERLYTRIEIKAVDTSQRLITGHAAATGNTDRVGDVIEKGAFDRTLKANPDVLVFIGHDASRMPVGEPSSMAQDTKGLLTTTRVYQTPAGDELLEVARERMSSGKTLGMSIGYRVAPGGSKMVRGVRHLSDIDLMEYSFLASPNLAANPEATVTGVKSHNGPELHDGPFVGTTCICDECKAFYIEHQADIAALYAPAKSDEQRSKAAVDLNSLPDSAFAFVEPGGAKDDEQKTVPRATRHFAHHLADGSVDKDLLEQAISEARTSPHGSKGLAHLLIHAKGNDAHAPEWSQGAILTLVRAHAELGNLIADVAKYRKAMDELGHDTKGGERLNQAIQTRIKALETTLGQVREQAESIERGEDGTAQVDLYRYAFQLLDLEEVA